MSCFVSLKLLLMMKIEQSGRLSCKAARICRISKGFPSNPCTIKAMYLVLTVFKDSRRIIFTISSYGEMDFRGGLSSAIVVKSTNSDALSSTIDFMDFLVFCNLRIDRAKLFSSTGCSSKIGNSRFANFLFLIIACGFSPFDFFAAFYLYQRRTAFACFLQRLISFF